MRQSAPSSSSAPLHYVIPLLFVFLWSTGFIAAKYVLPYAEPFTFLLLRFVIVVLLLWLIALALRAPWPTSLKQIGHISLVGLLVQGAYLGGVFTAIHQGVSAGLSALIVGMQPILTAVVVGPFLHEHISPRQWLGLVLGLAGVTLVVWHQISLQGGSLLGYLAAFAALAGITTGMIYQKKFCENMDLRSGTCIQYIAAAMLMLILAVGFETRVVQWTPQLITGLTWLTTVLSVGAVTLLWFLVRHGAAAKIASLFYLIPPVTAVLAYIVFDEALGTGGVIGMGVAALGVALVSRPNESELENGQSK